MKRALLCLALFCIMPSLWAADYVTTHVARRLTKAASEPASCNPGNVYYNTTSDTAWLCTATNIWTITGVVGTVSTTGLSAAVTTTNLVASAAAGLYQVVGYMQTTTQADGACTSDVTVGWTYNSSAKTLEIVSNHDQNTDEMYSQIPPTIMRSDGAANITYAISLDAGGDCTNATFDYYLTAERIQ